MLPLRILITSLDEPLSSRIGWRVLSRAGSPLVREHRSGQGNDGQQRRHPESSTGVRGLAVVHDREDGRIATDADRKRQRRRDREHRRPAELSQPVADVSEQTFEEGQALVVPVLFLDRFDRAELQHRARVP